MIIHLPMIRIMVPTCVIYSYAIFVPIVKWDVFDDTALDPKYYLDDKASQNNGIYSQAKLLGYTSVQTLYNLGSITTFMIFYLLRVIFLFGLKLYRTPYGNQNKLQKMYVHLKRNVFFEEFFYLLIEPYIEYLISGSL